MTNPNNAVGTNAAYGTRTSVNAFNDIAQLVNGRGVLSGWSVVPKTGMTVEVGGIAGTRDVAIAEDNLGNRTTINNKSNNPIEITLGAASASSNRYDAIVVYVNNPAQAADETPDAPSVCGVIAVQGGTTGVSEQQIRAAISADGGTGSVAYYAVLATIYIAAGTSSITSEAITSGYVQIANKNFGYAGVSQDITTNANDSSETFISIPRQPNADYIVILTLATWSSYWVDLRIRVGNRTETGFYISSFNGGGGTAGPYKINYLVIPQ